jgi:hypothetical protein
MLVHMCVCFHGGVVVYFCVCLCVCVVSCGLTGTSADTKLKHPTETSTGESSKKKRNMLKEVNTYRLPPSLSLCLFFCFSLSSLTLVVTFCCGCAENIRKNSSTSQAATLAVEREAEIALRDFNTFLRNADAEEGVDEEEEVAPTAQKPLSEWKRRKNLPNRTERYMYVSIALLFTHTHIVEHPSHPHTVGCTSHFT